MAANALSASTGAGFPSVPATEKIPVPAATRPRLFKTSFRLTLPLPLLWLHIPLLRLGGVGVVRGSRGGRLSARIVAMVVVESTRRDAMGGAHGVPPVSQGEMGATNVRIKDSIPYFWAACDGNFVDDNKDAAVSSGCSTPVHVPILSNV